MSAVNVPDGVKNSREPQGADSLEKADERLRTRLQGAREDEQVRVLFRLFLDTDDPSREAIRAQLVPLWERLREMGLLVLKAVHHPMVVVRGTRAQILRGMEDEAVFTASMDSPSERTGR
jgi:hypothetical protein